jgi:signal transduction histidine kinase/CheY-like chemotaxis protein
LATNLLTSKPARKKQTKTRQTILCVKRKPFSIRHHFLVLQGVSILLALWLLAAALDVSLLIRADLEHSVEKVDVERTTARLQGYTRALYLLLVAFGLFAALAVWAFRRMQHQHLWGPLEQLRRMTVEIRQGNLSFAPEVPRSVEVGPLVESFLSMAAELRAMRQSLEQKVVERTARLEQAQKQLFQAAKLSTLGRLAAGLAHEVNNPLTSILGFSEVLLGIPELNPQSRAHLETIRQEALRLKNVMAALASLGRSAPLHATRLDLREALDRLVELRRYHWTAMRIRLHYARPSAPAWVDGDPDQLLRVLFNLALNAAQAIQACPPGRACRGEGDLWLELAVAGSEIRISVRDNGVGMSPEILEHIFEPFFSGWGAGQAAGLGLSIVHSLVEQHHGRILPESVEGQGTTMTVVLPRALAPQPSVAPVQLPAPAEAPQEGHALVIDDEQDICALIQTALEQHGWRTTALNDSTAVGAALERGKFDVVICDFNMPVNSGLEVLRLLRQTRPELARRFLLITGDLPDVPSDADLSTVSVLQKPFTLAQLREAVHAVLERGNVRL